MLLEKLLINETTLFSFEGETNQERIRIGIAGAGHWGTNLIRVCAELGVLDSICEPDGVAVASLKGAYPTVNLVSNFDNLMLRPIDAVIIATPAHLHAEMCLAALRARKHVFVEKPLALSVDEGERIANAAEAVNLVIFVGHLLLYHPAVIKLLSHIADEEIGSIRHVRSRRLSLGKLREHENVWWSFAPHDIALMLALMGEEPVSVVAAQTSFRHTNLIDVAYADFEFSGGRSAHVEVCWLDPEKSARLDVFGDHGVLTLNDSRQGSSLFLRRFNIVPNSRGLPIASRGDEIAIDFDDQEPLRAEILAFIDAVRLGSAFPTTARQGVAVLRALSMADEALSKGTKLKALA